MARLRRIFDTLRCRLGFHDLKADQGRVNGVWWAFCRRCGARYGGEYDMATGETHWRPR